MCVCVFPSHLFWTSRSLDVPAGVTQEDGHTGFLIHLPSVVRPLIFLTRRIQPLFLSLVDREVIFFVCVFLFSSHLFWISSSLDVPGHTGGRSHRRKVTQEEGHTGGRSHRRKVTQDFSSIFLLRYVP